MSETAKGARPDIKLAAKNKATGERVHWASGWRTDRGVNLVLDKRVQLLIDGKPVTFGREGTHYLDMFEGEYKPQGGTRPQPAEPEQAAFDDSDIPF